jgi:hypothetical protein
MEVTVGLKRKKCEMDSHQWARGATRPLCALFSHTTMAIFLSSDFDLLKMSA